MDRKALIIAELSSIYNELEDILTNSSVSTLKKDIEKVQGNVGNLQQEIEDNGLQDETEEGESE